MHRHAAVQIVTPKTTPKKAFAPDEVCGQAPARAVLLVMASLRTASFKHDELDLSDDREDRRAEVTANMQQMVTLNRGFRCAKVDIHTV